MLYAINLYTLRKDLHYFEEAIYILIYIFYKYILTNIKTFFLLNSVTYVISETTPESND